MKSRAGGLGPHSFAGVCVERQWDYNSQRFLWAARCTGSGVNEGSLGGRSDDLRPLRSASTSVEEKPSLRRTIVVHADLQVVRHQKKSPIERSVMIRTGSNAVGDLIWPSVGHWLEVCGVHEAEVQIAEGAATTIRSGYTCSKPRVSHSSRNLSDHDLTLTGLGKLVGRRIHACGRSLSRHRVAVVDDHRSEFRQDL